MKYVNLYNKTMKNMRNDVIKNTIMRKECDEKRYLSDAEKRLRYVDSKSRKG